MHMMRGRLNARLERLRSAYKPDAELMADSAEDADELLGILVDLSEHAPEQGLEFTNEVYVLRHLLSTAMYASQHCVSELESGNDGDVQFAKAYRKFGAAKLTLDAPEKLLPKDTVTVRGERFWDRFTRLSEEREALADKTKRTDLGR